MSNPKKKPAKIEAPEEAVSRVQFTRAAMVRGLIFGTVLGLGIYGYRHGWFTSPPPQTAAEEAQAADRVAEHNLEFGKSLDRTNALKQWRQHAIVLEKINQSVGQSMADLPAILRDIAELETSDEGRKMSGDRLCLERFESFRAWTPPTDFEMRGWQSQADAMLAVCNAAINDESIIIGPDAAFIDNCNALDSEAGKACESVEAAARGLQFVRQASAGKEPQDKTIAEVLDQRELAQATELEEEKAAIREKAWDEKLKSDLAAEAAIAAEEQATREAEQRIRVAAAQTAREKEELRLKTLEDERRAAEEKKIKLARFDKALPEIRSLLAPMISPGTQQLGDGGWAPGEKGPVSFSRLQKCRSLELDERGMYMLGSIFCDVHERNDRPQGSFPMEMAAASSKGTIRRAQELLNEYGEILVEKGMLAP